MVIRLVANFISERNLRVVSHFAGPDCFLSDSRQKTSSQSTAIARSFQIQKQRLFTAQPFVRSRFEETSYDAYNGDSCKGEIASQDFVRVFLSLKSKDFSRFSTVAYPRLRLIKEAVVFFECILIAGSRLREVSTAGSGRNRDRRLPGVEESQPREVSA